MAGGIFISYRRDDAKHAAGRLVDRLVTAVGRDKLFMDVDNIEPGLDFVKVLNEQVARADVLLALIGPGWLEARDARGNRRLDNPADFVRIEIEAALARDIRVVPVLLDGAELPDPEALPESLRPLLRRNAVRISHERFGAEADALAATMKKALGMPDGAAPKAPFLSGLFATPAHPAKPATVETPARRASADTPTSPTTHLAATQSQSATNSTLGPKIAAALFALASFPITAALAVSADEGNWINVGNDQQAFFGACIGALLIFSSAVLLGRYRGSALTTFEATCYAFGVASACAVLVLLIFVVSLSNATGAVQFAAASVSAAVAILPTIAFNIWWRRRHPRS